MGFFQTTSFLFVLTSVSLASAHHLRPLRSANIPTRNLAAMGSIRNKGRPLAAHQAPLCTRTHRIGSLLLVFATFFLTRLLERSFPSCPDLSRHHHVPTAQSHVVFTGGGSLFWPERGYGSHLSLKIYVYDEDEIDGLKSLMYGRDGTITAEACLKGQWGTQVNSVFNSAYLSKILGKLM